MNKCHYINIIKTILIVLIIFLLTLFLFIFIIKNNEVKYTINYNKDQNEYMLVCSFKNNSDEINVIKHKKQNIITLFNEERNTLLCGYNLGYHSNFDVIKEQFINDIYSIEIINFDEDYLSPFLTLFINTLLLNDYKQYKITINGINRTLNNCFYISKGISNNTVNSCNTKFDAISSCINNLNISGNYILNGNILKVDSILYDNEILKQTCKINLLTLEKMS